MEAILAIVVGVLFAASFYLLLRRNLLRFIVGLIILSNAANLVIFTMGRLTREHPPIIPSGEHVPPTPYANPLPQALILTAIVISFGLLAFALVLVYRNFQSTDTLDTERIRNAEPPEPLEARLGEEAVREQRLPA